MKRRQVFQRPKKGEKKDVWWEIIKKSKETMHLITEGKVNKSKIARRKKGRDICLRDQRKVRKRCLVRRFKKEKEKQLSVITEGEKKMNTGVKEKRRKGILVTN